MSDKEDPLPTETQTSTETFASWAEATCPVLTVLWHSDPERTGERAVLAGLPAGRTMALSRLEPSFAAPGGGPERPLGERRLSRSPLELSQRADGTVVVDAGLCRTPVLVDGQPLGTARSLGPAELERGVVVLLANRVVLLLHRPRSLDHLADDDGLVGDSAVMVRVRQDVRKVAGLPWPVLIRGESGTGKELVAAAVHARSPRSHGPFLAVNMGAVPSSLAAAELFGATRGAYSGAEHPRQGYFQQAAGGTLLLDEIGEAPRDVQVLLLRALETRQVQPVGGERPRRVDVRVLAATDADLEAAVQAGTFRLALLHRLAASEIVLPPLRERRDDFGRLFLHFLRRELESAGAVWRLEPPPAGGRPWVPARLVAHLAAWEWPGNVRQLRNVVRQLVVAHADQDEMRMPAEMAHRSGVGARPFAEPWGRVSRERVSPDEIGEDELRATLAGNRFEVAAAARDLGVSRPSLYNLMRRFGIRKAADLTREELAVQLERHGADLGAMAAELEVSRRGLKIRLTELGLGWA